MKYQRSTTSDCKDIGVRNSEFVAKTQFLCKTILKTPYTCIASFPLRCESRSKSNHSKIILTSSLWARIMISGPSYTKTLNQNNVTFFSDIGTFYRLKISLIDISLIVFHWLTFHRLTFHRLTGHFIDRILHRRHLL